MATDGTPDQTLPVPSAAPAQQTPPLSPYATISAFEANVTMPVKRAGRYLVFARNAELIFIRRNGSSTAFNVIAHLLGPIGGIVTLLAWLVALAHRLFTNRFDPDEEEELKSVDPYQLLQSSRYNFKLHASEIRSAVAHARTFWSLSHGQAGRIDLVVRMGEQFRLEFATAAELATALLLLEPVLQSALEVNVVWNPERQRFEPDQKKR
ncbi:MAG: hypothetical protein NZ739_04540 [Verrucomicrobiae bacterium]|nr:hypothetical protein [Verrucomicrobiae bacterium]